MNLIARERIVGDRKPPEAEYLRIQIERKTPRGKIEHGAQWASVALVERGENVKDAHRLQARER